MAFSAADSAIEGFKIVRRHPVALLYWSLLYAVTLAVSFAVVGGSMISLMAEGERLEALGSAVSLEDFMPLMQSMGAMMAIMLPISLIASAMVYAAVSRAVLRPTERRFGYLQLGGDELRVLAVSVVLTLIFAVLLSLSWGVLFGLGAAAVNAPMLWLLVVLFFFASSAGFIWLAIRLSLAVPITMAERRIALFDSFKLTKGRFWPLFGMTLLAGVLGLLVSVLGSAVMAPFQLLAGGGVETLAGAEGMPWTEVLTRYWPVLVAYVVLNAIVSAMQVAVFYAPFSAAYRDIIGPSRTVAETFS